MLKRTAQAGFTIIEMLIVVTILAMLAGILVPVLEDAAQSSRDSRRASDLKSVQASLDSFMRVNGAYPDTSGNWQGDAATYGSFTYDAAGYIPGLVPNYLPALPKDPSPDFPNATGGYMYRSDGTDYKFVLDGTPENADSFAEGFPFYDAQRADSWMICTPGGYDW